jgi:hypothetical protein
MHSRAHFLKSKDVSPWQQEAVLYIHMTQFAASSKGGNALKARTVNKIHVNQALAASKGGYVLQGRAAT